MNQFGSLSEQQVKNTFDALMGIINPDETLQQRVVTECMSVIAGQYPQVTIVYNKHFYYMFMNMSWFSYFIFKLFTERGLLRDMKAEIQEVDEQFRGIKVLNRLSKDAVSLLS